MELHKAFENWVDEQGVIDYCKKNYSFIYDTATNTLNSAVKKGWLQRDDNASPKKYKLTWALNLNRTTIFFNYLYDERPIIGLVPPAEEM